MKILNSLYKFRGFTLIEVSVVLAIITVVAAMSLPTLQRKSDEALATRSAEEIRQVLIQAREHRAETGAWPSSPAVLVTADRILPSAANSVYGTPYVFTVVAGNNLEISVDAGVSKHAIRLAGSDLPFAARSGNVVTTRIAPPGDEAALDALYALDGSRALTGNMNANGNSITGVNQLTATGAISTTNDITGRRITATDRVISQNGFQAQSNAAYIVRPDGASNIRNLTAEQIRGTYVQSTGAIDAGNNITAGGSITASGNISTSSDLYGRDANLSRNVTAGSNITAGGVVRGSQLVSTGNVNGVDIIASNSIQAPELRATIKFSAPRFESSVNPSYHLTPAGSSNLYDVTARNMNLSYLSVTGNTAIGGSITVGGAATVSGTLTANDITSNTIVYSRYGFASRDNPSFIVVPDGFSNMNHITANTIRARGQFYAEQNANVTGDIIGGRHLTVAQNATIMGNTNIGGNVIANGLVQGASIVSAGNVTANGDISGRNLTLSQNATISGAANIGGGANVTGNVNATGNITANGDLTGRNLTLSQSAIINSNMTANGNVTAGNSVYGRRFYDTEDLSTYADPSGTSIFRNLALQGSLELNQFVSEGGGCSGRRIGLGGSGELLSCVSGTWRGPSSGSTVLTGTAGHNSSIPIPSGFTAGQCNIAVAASDTRHGGNPNNYAGGFAYASGGRVICGFRDDWNTYFGGNGCTGTYIVSCNR